MTKEEMLQALDSMRITIGELEAVLASDAVVVNAMRPFSLDDIEGCCPPAAGTTEKPEETIRRMRGG